MVTVGSLNFRYALKYYIGTASQNVIKINI